MCQRITLPVIGLRTHIRRVQNLYKKALRHTQSCVPHRPSFRFEASLLRKRFEDNRDVADIRLATLLVEKGEQEVVDRGHPYPLVFPTSYDGTAYDPEGLPPDWVVDYWHPLEKAEYPDYFKRREQRKDEFVRSYQRMYGKTEVYHDPTHRRDF